MNIAIIGAGYIYEDLHLPVILKSSNKLIYVVENNKNNWPKINAKLPAGATCVDNYKEIDLSKIDGVIVATPILSHYAICKYFLENSKHVLCEKPLTPTYDEAMELKELAETKKVTLQVGFNRRFQPVTAFIKECIDTKRYGNLNSVLAKGGWILKGRIAPTLADRKISMGGIMLDYGIHYIDRICSWVDGIEPQSYYDDAEDGGVEVNATFYANLKLNNQQFKPSMRMVLSWTSPMPNSIELHFDDAVIINAINSPASIQIFHTRNLESTISKVQETAAVNLTIPDNLTHNDLQLGEFVKKATGESGRYLSNLDDAIQASKIIEWCYGHKEQLVLPYGL